MASFGDLRTRKGWSFQEEAWQPWILLLSWKGLIYWGVHLWAQEGPSQVLLPCGVTMLMGTVACPCQGTCRVRVHDETCTGERAPPLHFLGPRVSLDPWHCRDHPTQHTECPGPAEESRAGICWALDGTARSPGRPRSTVWLRWAGWRGNV